MNQSPWWLNRKIAIATITITVATITTIIRFTGGFETLELKRYDYFWTKRAIATWDKRIIIVGYTEEDRKKYGESPPDETIRKVLEKVKQARPTTVGLFFKRDMKPVDSQQRDLLNQQIESIPYLIKADGEDRLAPEPDNIMRKIPLYKRSSTKPHIVWAVAKHYLENTGASIREKKEIVNRSITITYPDGNQAIIKPLTLLNDGGYNSSVDDLMNFQVLISWPFSSEQGFKTYSFDTIINNPPPNFQDKLVIVGEMKPRNIFKAPIQGKKDIYSFLYSSEVAGIIISNILQQSEVPFVKVWSDPMEYLYFYGWLIASGIMVLWLCEELDPAQKWAKYLLSIAITLGVFLLTIYTISLAAFPKTWIPSVFLGRGVSFTILFGSLVCLEFKVREEQNQSLEKQKKIVEEQNKRIQEKERLEKQQEIEIKTLEKTVIAQERLAFIGRLSPFLNHKILNLQNDLELNISNSELDLRDLEYQIYELLDLLIDMLEEEEADDKKEIILDLLQTLRKRCSNERKVLQRTNELLEKFLPKVRTESSEHSDAEFLDINDIIKESSSISDYDFKSFHINFYVKIQLELSDNIPLIYGLSSELQFALVNIIENAYYAVWEKSQMCSSSYIPIIKVSSSVFQDRVLISVEDNGVGIDKDKEQSIFKPFYSTKKRFQGMSGVGLTLTKDILEQYYNGKIYLDTHQTHTCFVIELPYPSV